MKINGSDDGKLHGSMSTSAAIDDVTIAWSNSVYNATVEQQSLGVGAINDDFMMLDEDNVGPSRWMIFNLTLYAIICAVGTVGNGLVIYVVLRYSAMRNSVTNSYIVNLAVSDFCFLIGLPFVIVTALFRRWIFGAVMCKLFYSLTSLNWFTSVFTLTVMSADRYLAVCYAVESRQYRTVSLSRVVCAGVWIASLLVMTPIYLYGRTVEEDGKISCTIKWPDGQAISPDQAFIWYAFFLGFAVPVAAISVFYTLVVIRLRTLGPKKQSKGKKKSQRKVTILVLTVIAVYVTCWLPYWLFQITLLFIADEQSVQVLVQLFQIITVLSYANSAVNPVLYAFLSENFRKTFSKAFCCTTSAELNRTLLKNERLQSATGGASCSLAPSTSVTATALATKQRMILKNFSVDEIDQDEQLQHAGANAIGELQDTNAASSDVITAELANTEHRLQL